MPRLSKGVICIGQTLAQLLHFIRHDESTVTLVNALGNGDFLGVTRAESVPIGQNEHHVRGAKTNDRMMPTMVVMNIMFQNTRPIAFQSPHAKCICTPNTVNINRTINVLNPFVLTKAGIGR